MRYHVWSPAAAVVPALVLGLALAPAATAHDGHDHGAPHGGALAKARNHHFEVVFTQGGVKLYPLTAEHGPVDASHLSATATFYHPSTPRPWFSRALRPAAAAGTGRAQAPLEVAIDLGKVPAQGVKVAFQVSGLPDPAEPTATFTVPFAFTPSPSTDLTVAKATSADQQAINAQKVCKVSGEDLFSMGGPVKVSRGDTSVLVCCQGCVKKVKAEPQKYFAPQAAAPARDEHKHAGHGH